MAQETIPAHIDAQLTETVKRNLYNENGELYNLHAIDMTNTDAETMVKELMEQMTTIGFLVLTNIQGYDEERYLEACKALHALPEEEKMALYLRKDNPANSNFYRGYQPFKPNDASHKEFFDQGFPVRDLPPSEASYPLYEKTPFPNKEKYGWIRDVFNETRAVWYSTALAVVRHLSVGLGKPESFFDSWFKEGSLSTMRTIHYLPRSAGLVDSSHLKPEEAMLTTPEHADSGFLTFLATFGYPGLQVLIDGEYKSVAPIKNTLVVNIGDTFARLTDYRLKATYHRVLDIGVERFSSPLFLEPKYSARIPKGLLESDRTSAEQDVGEEDVMFGDWLIRRMMASYVEWQNFDIPASRRKYIEAVQLSDFVN